MFLVELKMEQAIRDSAALARNQIFFREPIIWQCRRKKKGPTLPSTLIFTWQLGLAKKNLKLNCGMEEWARPKNRRTRSVSIL